LHQNGYTAPNQNGQALLQPTDVRVAQVPGPVTFASVFDDPDVTAPMDEYSEDELPPPPLADDDPSDNENTQLSSDSDSDDDLAALLPDHVIDSFKRAENKFKLKEPTTKPRPPPATPQTVHIPDGAPFVMAARFTGAVPGYVFKTSGDKTGYYKDLPRLPPLEISLERIVPSPVVPPDVPNILTKQPWRTPARNGARFRGKGRRAKPLMKLEEFRPLIEGVTDLGDTSHREYGLWAVDTINPNSWTAAEERIMCRVGADYVALQESRVSSENGILKLKREARNLGWNGVADPAWASPAGAGSGGCAVFARRGTGVAQPPGLQVPEGLRHRIVVAWAAGLLPGGVHIISIYLIDGAGLNEENLEILHQVSAILRQLKGPWIIAGDWNVDYATIAASRWPELVRGTIVAPALPTCFSSTYDFFIVSEGLAHVVAGIARIDDAGLYPRKPVRLYVHSACRRFMTRQLARPARVDGVLPAGPLPRPRCPEQYYPTEVTMEAVDVAAAKWFYEAKAEWASLSCTEPDTSGPRFRWRPAVGPRAAAQAGATAQAAFWRNAARRLDECASAVQHAVDDAGTIARKHLEKIALACAQARFPDSDLPHAMGWTQAAAAVIAGANAVAIRRHAATAVGTAVRLETAARNHRLAQWRKTLVRVGPGGRATDAAPSKCAYQWLRGATGWTRSPIADSALNEAVLESQVEEDDAPAHLIEDTATTSRIWKRKSAELAPVSDQGEVEQEACFWAKLWNEGMPYHALVDPHGTAPLPPLTVAAIRSASNSFPVGTGVGAEHVAPRALARLSDHALRGLCAVLMAAELLGRWPSIAALVLIVLLPKPDGGRRPIGLFPAIIRVWARARSHVARAWEAEHPRRGLYGGPAMGAQKAAWQAGFQAEAAALSRSNYAQALLDLVKAFETVPHDVVARLADKHKLNLWLVRLSLASYRLARTIGIDGSFSRMIIAARGITAGSVFATTELRVIMLEAIDETVRIWPSISLSVYVDDCTLECAGPGTRPAAIGRRHRHYGEIP